MNKFPSEISAWKNDVARRLVRLRGEVDGIMINLPMLPDPEIGMPFTGPLSPVPFVWTPTDRSGGTNTGGTPNTGGTLGTVGGCPGARRFTCTVTITGANPLCSGDVGSHSVDKTFTSHIGTNCLWQTSSPSDSNAFSYSTSTGTFTFQWSNVWSYNWLAVVEPPSEGNSVVLPLYSTDGPCSTGSITVTGLS